MSDSKVGIGGTPKHAIVQRWVDALWGLVEPWELESLEDSTYINDAFARDLTFGTGGIRGLMGVGPNRLNVITVGRATQGVADHLIKNVRHAQPTVVVAYDTRIHSRAFAELTAGILAANGIMVHLFEEPVPTPVLSYAVRELGCDAGIVITASHNPKEYNGYKVYGPTGDQATDALAYSVQREMEALDPFRDVRHMQLDEAVVVGRVVFEDESLVDRYVEAVLSQRVGIDCSGLKVVYSPLNGTGLMPAKKVASGLGLDMSVVPEQSAPDGSFPTCPRPNPELPAAMQLGEEQMFSKGADLLLASDPDADRIGVAVPEDDGARLLTGDEVGLLLLDFLGRYASRPSGKPVVVTTIVSSPLADAIAYANGLELRRTLTGFKYAGEQIDLLEKVGEAQRFFFAFEESCGYLRGTYVRDKDSMVAFALVCEMAAMYKREGKTLSVALDELHERYGSMVGKQLTVELPGQAGRAAMTRAMRSLRDEQPRQIGGLAVEYINDYTRGAAMPVVGAESGQTLPAADVLEFSLAGGSKVIIRPSGTEPKIKCYCFAAGDSNETATKLLEEIGMDVDDFLSDCREGTADGDRGINARLVHVILLSGGSGTRLWPLSNSARSKQFLKVLRDDKGNHVSMVQRVFSQIEHVDADVDLTIATSAAQAEELALQVPSERYTLVAEPERRDTAPAIMLACANLALQQGADDDDPVIVMPIDTYADQAYYDRIPRIAQAVEMGNTELVLLGVHPTYPSEKYGYILPSSTEGEVWPVREFKEKPDEATASKYICEGGLWNCGVFAFRLGYLRNITNRYYNARSYEELLAHYSELPRNSFDYEVVERAKSISVVPYTGTWKDLGTWNTLTEEMADSYAGDVHADQASLNNVHVINETNLPIVVAGINDAVVVATPDGILVSGKEASAHIKGLVSEAAKDAPMQETRAWGSYEVLDDLAGQSTPGGVRELKVHAGETTPATQARMDLRYIVVAGSGIVENAGIEQFVSAGSVVEVSALASYSFSAKADLSLVEIQIPSTNQ